MTDKIESVKQLIEYIDQLEKDNLRMRLEWFDPKTMKEIQENAYNAGLEKGKELDFNQKLTSNE